MDGLARGVLAWLPHTLVSKVGAQLVAAGRPMTTQSFFTIVALTGGLFPGVAFLLLLLSNGGSAPALVVIFTLGFSALGFLLPFVFLRRAVRTRKLAIWKSLPDAFDLVTVCVEAGLGLDAALRQVADKLQGPLADEIGQTLREVGMGRGRREALEDLSERVDVPELGTFVNAVIQAEKLGTSLGRVLRAQGVTLRIHRRQRAEEVARRAPIKMVFPLVLFIMPTFFLVTLGPIGVRLVSYLSD
jgi:tight adherence protein C